jgi:hypothetical protein
LIENNHIAGDRDEEYEITDPVIPTVLYAKIKISEEEMMLLE